MLKRLSSLLAIFILLLCLPAFTMDSPPQSSKPAFVQFKLPHDTYIMFSTRQHALIIYPDVFRNIEQDGRILLGYTFLPGDGHNGVDQRKTVILVMTDTPEIYTQAYLQRLAKIMYAVNAPYDMTKLDMLLDRPVDEWGKLGVLDHEMCHVSDALPDCCGRQRVLIHRLFPLVVEQPPINEPKANPWAALKILWPSADTHPGYSRRVY